MNKITHHRYTAIPPQWVNDSINYIAVSPGIMEVYVVDSAGAVRRIFNEADVQILIDSAIAAAGGVSEVADIAARDALTPSGVVQVYVTDAAADATVDSGGAFYLYRPNSQTWIKTGEDESLDLVLNYDTLQGRPSSSAAAIDLAVGASHSHANLTQLNQIGQDADGCLTYDGDPVGPNWATEEW